MSTIEQSIDVNVPVSTAYNQWTQFEEFPRFMEGVEAVRQLDQQRLHHGKACRIGERKVFVRILVDNRLGTVHITRCDPYQGCRVCSISRRNRVAICWLNRFKRSAWVSASTKLVVKR